MTRHQKFNHKYRPESIRLQGWDYTSHALYLVTICTKFRSPWFGHVADGSVVLSPIGQRAKECWAAIPQHHVHVALDAFVIMPDHVHGIILVRSPKDASTVPPISEEIFSAETRHGASLQKKIQKAHYRFCARRTFGPLQVGSLSTVMNHFKGSVTRWCIANGYEEFQWQERFRDDRIRSMKQLRNVRVYIQDNAQKWQEQYGSDPPWSYR